MHPASSIRLCHWQFGDCLRNELCGQCLRKFLGFDYSVHGWAKELRKDDLDSYLWPTWFSSVVLTGVYFPYAAFWMKMAPPKASLRQFYRSIDCRIPHMIQCPRVIRFLPRQNSAYGVSSRPLLPFSKLNLSRSPCFRTFRDSSRTNKQWSQDNSRSRNRLGVKILNISPRQAIVRGV